MCKCIIKETIVDFEVLDENKKIVPMSVSLHGIIKSQRRRKTMINRVLPDLNKNAIFVEENGVKYVEDVYSLSRDSVIENGKKIKSKEL